MEEVIAATDTAYSTPFAVKLALIFVVKQITLQTIILQLTGYNFFFIWYLHKFTNLTSQL